MSEGYHFPLVSRSAVGDGDRTINVAMHFEDADALLGILEGDAQSHDLPNGIELLRQRLEAILESAVKRGAATLTGADLLAARKRRRDELWAQLREEERILKAAGAIAADLKVTPPEDSQPVPKSSTIEIRLADGQVVLWDIGKMGTEAALEMLRRAVMKSKVIRIGNAWINGRCICTYIPKGDGA
jgi:hypothetical protein